jgi:hypothetical protein
LKIKLEDLEQMQEKREVWLKNNMENVKALEQKVAVCLFRCKPRRLDCPRSKAASPNAKRALYPSCKARKR